MLVVFVYLFTTDVIRVSNCEEQPAPLDINDLFPSFNESDENADISADAYTNISLDIEKLDLYKFKNKILREMQPKLLDEDNEFGNSRRTFQIKFDKHDSGAFKTGFNIALNQLHCDMILQLIYMAKGQIATIEENPNVNTEDFAYRIGYLSHKCFRLFRKLGRILGFMRKWQFFLHETMGHIILHHRSVRLHIDILYYYWVVNNLDAKFKQRFPDKFRLEGIEENSKHYGISFEVKSLEHFHNQFDNHTIDDPINY